MKKSVPLILGIVCMLAVIGFVVYSNALRPQLQDRSVSTVVATPVVNQEYDIGFSYQGGEAGYTLIEPPAASTSPIKQMYLLLQTPSYIEFQNSGEEAREGPPSISLFIFDASSATSAASSTRTDRLLAWAYENPQYSSINLIQGEIESVKIDGLNAVRYTADGLYQQDVYLASYSGNIYVFTGQSLGADDAMQQAFTEFMGSITFY